MPSHEIAYLGQIHQDFDALGLAQVHAAAPVPPTGLQELYGVLVRTRSMAPELLEARDMRGLELKTAVGERVFALLGGTGETPVRFDRSQYLVACSGAERKLLKNIAPSSVATEQYRSPIVITDNDEPVGIIKGMGEKGCYALVDNLEHGLVAGCFSQSNPYTDLGTVAETLPGSTQAWSLPIEQAGQFAPVRFSAYTVMHSVREQLATAEASKRSRVVLLSDHDTIVAQAHKMLEDAVPLEYSACPQPQLLAA